MADHPNIVSVDSLPWKTREHGDRFSSEFKRLGPEVGCQQIGCGLFRLQPGKTAFPSHVHHGNEETVYILSGEGVLRLDGEEFPVAQGDYIGFPAGGPAHQLLNRSDGPLEYFCFSTLIAPEVVEYPDSGKVGVMAGDMSGPPEKRRMWKIFRKDENVDYYDGE